MSSRKRVSSRCSNCGKENEYAQKEWRGRELTKCRYCNHTLSICHGFIDGYKMEQFIKRMNKKAQSTFWTVVIFILVVAIIAGLIYLVKNDKVIEQGSVVGKINSLGMGDGFFDDWYVLYLEGDNENVYCYDRGSSIDSTLNYSKIASLPVNITYTRFLLRGTTCRSNTRKSSYVITSARAIEKEENQ